MINKIYIFEIQDNDDKYSDRTLMLYTEKKSFLTPLIDDFERGWPTFLSFENIIKYLTNKKIDTMATYSPRSLETICSHPYEIGDFTDEELEFGVCAHRFSHFEFSPSKEQLNLLKENKITIEYLKDNKIDELENRLNYHY